MIYLNNDILYIILDFLVFSDKLNSKKVSKRFNKFYIFEICEENLSCKINQQILEQETYLFIKSLNLNYNKNNFDLNFLSKLKELYIKNTSITNDNVKKLNLEKLNITFCEKITNINHMSNLKILYAGYDFSINDDSIKNLNIEELYVYGNENISNINHMTKIKVLDASYICLNTIFESGIDDNGIKNINLEELYANDNKKITNVNHMTNLKILHAGDECGIDDFGIKDLIYLEELYVGQHLNISGIVTGNEKITNINHMKKLKILYACGEFCGLDDHGINELLNLEELYVNDNNKITNINYMKNLKRLHARYKSGIDDNNIKNLNLVELDIRGNTKIKKINHLTNLKILNASGIDCLIDDQDIKEFLNLEILYVHNNNKIKNINHMTKLKKLYASGHN